MTTSAASNQVSSSRARWGFPATPEPLPVGASAVADVPTREQLKSLFEHMRAEGQKPVLRPRDADAVPTPRGFSLYGDPQS